MHTQQTWYDKRRYYAARRCWRMHNANLKPSKFKTWPLWWEDRYGDGETFEEYVKRQQQERQ